MPNIAKVLKEEIARIAKHEAKVAVTPIRKPSIRLRKDLAVLKTRFLALEKANKELHRLVANIQTNQPAPAPTTESARKGWISGKGVKSLRRRLGLSQPEFSKLVGVSSKTVLQWESKPGTLMLRNATKTAVFAIRNIGAREAAARLQEMRKKPVKSPKAKRAKKVGKKTAHK